MMGDGKKESYARIRSWDPSGVAWWGKMFFELINANNRINNSDPIIWFYMIAFDGAEEIAVHFASSGSPNATNDSPFPSPIVI